jgi:hypothetical protein
MNPLFHPFDFQPDPMDTARRLLALSTPAKPAGPPPDVVPSSTPGGEPQLPDNTAEGVVPAEGDPSTKDATQPPPSTRRSAPDRYSRH